MFTLGTIQQVQQTGISLTEFFMLIMAYIDARNNVRLARYSQINREIEKMYASLPPVQPTSDPTLEEAREWLYRSEFDSNGKVIRNSSSYNYIDPTKIEEEDDSDIYEASYSEESREEREKQNQMVSSTKNKPKGIDRIELEKGLKELNAITGLGPVKQFVYELKDMVEIQQEREAVGQKVKTQNLNMIFRGNPGTGKTTVARVVGQIMKGLGVVSEGHLVEVTRADLVEDHMGGSAKKTAAVFKKALGGILFIDEAYSVSRGERDEFGREAVDTLVKLSEDHAGEIIIILAGYTKEMGAFLKTNSGLKSRFPNDIEFPDYTPEELLQITKGMIKGQDFKTTSQTDKILLGILEKRQIAGRNDSGNGRLARNILDDAVRKQSKRLHENKPKNREEYFVLTPEDFGYKKESRFDLEKELQSVVGNENIKSFVRTMEAQVKLQKRRKELGLANKSDSLHMVFKGNPGTGKTTIARIMGRMFKELGVLKSGHMVEVTREDLVGEYVGHTALKTREVVERAIGGVLFIDEAYSLARGGQNDFGREAVDTLVKMMEEHYENLIVIVAGYHNEMNDFFKTNSGLKSRFPNSFDFKDYTLFEMSEIAKMMAKSEDYIIPDECFADLMHVLLKGVGNKEDGNGRYVRNVLAKAKQNLAIRIGRLENPTKDQMQTFIGADFKS